jgi:hypothetical protein
MADKDIEQARLASAIENLQKALSYNEASFINYKLAILTKDVDPLLSYSYMEKTFQSDPGIINYDIYEKILLEVIKYYEKTDKQDSINLFKHKLKVVKKFREKYLISSDSFSIEEVSSIIKPNFFGNGKTVTVKFKIKNNTHDKISVLYVQVNAIYNGITRVVFKQQLFSKKSPMEALGSSPLNTIKFTFNDSSKPASTNKMIFDFYVTKNFKVRKTKIHTLDIEK